MELFGFATREEKRIFEMLLGVGGVGPKAALSLLSTVPPDQLTLAVMTGNEKALTSAPGVGKKMAQRVILELKDKLGANLELDFSSGPVSVPAPDSGMALAKSGVPATEYTPMQVKQAVVGYGKAEKHQVMDMTKRILKLEKMVRPDDAADAIAIALCHGRSSSSLLARLTEE